MTDRYLVIGDPVAHSLSPAIQQAAFDHAGIDAVYERRRVAAGDLVGFIEDIRTGAIAGANVTMPHKRRAFELADVVEGPGRTAESVNTLLRRGSQVIGLSTDIPAIENGCRRNGVPTESVLVLGAGGASAAALHAFRHAELFLSARNQNAARSLAERFGAQTVEWGALVPGVTVVNATPLGMRGESLPTGVIAESVGLLDMAYGPLPTPSIIAARTLGLPTVDGLEMLVGQAALSFEAWIGAVAPYDVMMEAAQIAQGW